MGGDAGFLVVDVTTYLNLGSYLTKNKHNQLPKQTKNVGYIVVTSPFSPASAWSFQNFSLDLTCQVARSHRSSQTFIMALCASSSSQSSSQ
jgi:sialic acid synthase SpsE